MRCQALDVHRFKPADTNHLSQPAGEAGQGSVGAADGKPDEGSLRSDLLGRTDRTACACRASTQTTGRPWASNVCVSHTDVGPLSRPTRTTFGACLRIT